MDIGGVILSLFNCDLLREHGIVYSEKREANVVDI
jgi:hypothetical protein